MKITAVLTLMLCFLINETTSAQTYQVDNTESRLEWKGRKVTGSHNGILLIQSGELEFKEDLLTGGEFVMDMTTIRVLDLTNRNMNKKLLDHLKSEDFFSVEEHPASTFKITEVVPAEDNNYTITGDLTIKETTSPVTFEAQIELVDQSLNATAVITYDRTVYDIKYGSGSFFSNLGDNMINDEIQMTVNLKAIQQ
ncbi:MAG: YceI family protein [Bacteroidota bacterium]